MENFLNNLKPEIVLFILSFFLIIVLFLMNLSNRAKIKRLRAKYNKFMNGLSDRNIEQLLDDCIDYVNEVNKKNREIENHINHIERNLLQCVQKVGIVRFNAFENVGSDLSFSIAMLDANDNGIVVSGIYARDSSSTYAKPVMGGKSRYVMSGEEIQAIDVARKSYGERPYTEKK